MNGAGIEGGTVTNSGEIDLTGAAVLENGWLGNSGTIDVSGLGNALHNEHVTANNGLEILSGGALTIDQDLTVTNTGMIRIDDGAAGIGELTIDDATIDGGSVLNSGAINLTGLGVLKNGSLSNFNFTLVSGLGNALHNETIAVGGALQIVSGGALTVDQGSTVFDPFSWEVVDGTLTLDDATINSGVVFNDAGGIIDLTGSAVVKNGSLFNFGQLNVSGAGNALHDETVTDGAALEVLSGGALLLDLGTAVTNAGGTITADAGATLTLDMATIDGGTLSVSGTLDATGNSTLTDVGITNHGLIEATGGVLTIDPAALVTLTNFGTLEANGGELDITGEPVINTGTLQAIGNSTLKLASLAVTNTGGIVTVGNGSTLDLTGVTINGGSLGNSGRIDLSGTGNALDKVTVTANHTLEILAAGLLLLDQGTTVANAGGTITVDGTATLMLNHATIDGGTIDDYNTVSGSVVAGLIDVTGDSTISGASLNYGDVKIEQGISLTLDNVAVTGTSIEVDSPVRSSPGDLILENGTTITDSQLTVDSNDLLTLKGATINGGTLTDNGIVDAIGGSNTIEAGTTVHNHGTIEATGGTLTIYGAIVNDGVLKAEGGTLVIDGDVTGTGTAIIGNGGTLDLAGADAQTITFDGPGTLKLEASSNFTGTISGLASIDLAGTVATSAYFDGSTLLVNGQPVTFDISVPAGDTVAFKSDGSGGTILKVLPQVLSVGAPAPAAGVEGAAIHLAFSDTVTGAKLASFVIGGIPDGAVITDGTPGHTYTSGSADGSVDVACWNLSNLTITPADAANFTLKALVTAVDGNGYDYSLPETEIVVVSPTAPTVAPVAESGVEGTAIALDLGTTVNGLPGDTNSLASLVVSTIPVGATLSDGHGDSFTAVAGSTSVDVHDWTLSSLAIKPADDTSFTLHVAATEHDAEGNLSATATGTEVVTVTPDVPKIVSETDPAEQAVIVVTPGTPIVLAPGSINNTLGLNTETFNGQSEGSHSNNGAGYGNFYTAALNATFSASGHAGVVDNSSNVTSAPFIGPLPGGADTTNYLSIGGGASETITFGAEENAFGLYWGSVDSYNTIAFYHGGTLVTSYTGADIAPLLANGGQGSFASNGYVEFYGLPSFDKVVLGSTSNAFEIDNISAGSIPGPHAELAAPIAGTLSVSDAAAGDTLTASVLGDAVATYNGSTTLPGNLNLAGLINAADVTFGTATSDGGTDVLHWTYNANNPNLDFLKSGDTLTLTFTAQVSNGLHTSVDQPLTITIAGTNTSADLSQFKFVNGTSQNDTFGDVHGNVTIFGAGGQDTFVFKPNFGNPTIADFNVNNDTINISQTLFTSVQAILAGAQSTNSGHDTVITDSHHDTITLLGVTVAQLQQHPSDFHLV